MRPVSSIFRWVRALWPAAAAIGLGAASVVVTSLLIAYWSSAYGLVEWNNLVRRGDRMASVASDASVGKTILNWVPLNPRQTAEFESAGTVDSLSRTLGQHECPGWSAIWNDAAFAEATAARTQYGNFRHDIAIGWPWRAFTCLSGTDESLHPAASVVRGGIELPTMLVDRGTGNRWGEPRAIPLVPIWRGIAGDLVVWTLAWLAAIVGLRVRSTRVRRRLSAEPSGLTPRRPRQVQELTGSRSTPLLARRTWWPRGRECAAFLIIGVISTAVVSTVLPLISRERSVGYGATDRLDTGLQLDLWWSKHSTTLSPEEARDLTPETARAFDHSLSRLHYTGASRLWACSPHKFPPPTLAESHPFNSVQTGVPFPCLWGAYWRDGANPPMQTGLAVVPKATGLWSFFNRGLDTMPTIPLWWGWIGDSLIHAAGWGALALAWGCFRRARRRRRGLCTRCAYDLRATPVGKPCPECGQTP